MATLTVTQTPASGNLGVTTNNGLLINCTGQVDFIFAITLPSTSNISFFQAPFPMSAGYGNFAFQLTPGGVVGISSPRTSSGPGIVTGFTLSYPGITNWVYGMMMGSSGNTTDFSNFSLSGPNPNGSYVASYSDVSGTTTSLTIQLHPVVVDEV